MNKKGDVDVLFKWIFGVIAGAVILVFFVRLSYIHISGGESLEGNLLLVDVDDRLDALGISEGSDMIDLKDDFSLGFNCGELTLNTFERSTDKVVFAPLRLNGDNIYVWTDKWKFPYGITTFFYLNNPKNRVLLVADANKIEDVASLAKNIPLGFMVQTTTKQLFKPEAFSSQAKGSDKITVVFFGAVTYAVQELKQAYGNSVEVEVIEVNLDENRAKIYDNKGNTEEVFYLGEEMLYGLIFSGKEYSCVKDIAIERLRAITDIYIEKTGRLMGKISENQNCVDLLNEERKMLERYKATSHEDEFYELKDKIDKQNRKLEKEVGPAAY